MSNRIAITLGDPGAIGPDICVKMASSKINKNHVIITDPSLLVESSKKLKVKLKINELDRVNSKTSSGPNLINVLPVKLKVKNKPGFKRALSALPPGRPRQGCHAPP